MEAMAASEKGQSHAGSFRTTRGNILWALKHFRELTLMVCFKGITISKLGNTHVKSGFSRNRNIPEDKKTKQQRKKKQTSAR